jgi:putative FmdB family regulatory protein
MPIYSYKCENCGEVYDKFVKAGGNGKVKCVMCHSDTKRVFSPVGIIFKGSGFYSTDYKAASKNTKVAGSSSPSSSEKAGDKKHETSNASNKEKSPSSEKVKSSK